MIWIIIALYVLGFIGLNAMSFDYSTGKRSLLTRVGLVFWPVTILVMAIGDLYDGARGRGRPAWTWL